MHPNVVEKDGPNLLFLNDFDGDHHYVSTPYVRIIDVSCQSLRRHAQVLAVQMRRLNANRGSTYLRLSNLS
jgi:hypothetical protein